MNWTAPQILVVAQEPAVRFTIEELLRAYGYDVTTAPSSAAGLPLDPENRFAAILFGSAVRAKPALDQPPGAKGGCHEHSPR